MKIAIIGPYGTIPGESWRETRFAMMADHLAHAGHEVTWWTADFAHHSKRFRTAASKPIIDQPYTIRLVRTPAYRSHIGAGRLFFEFMFAVRTYLGAMREAPPDVVISGDAAMATSFASAALASRRGAKLVFDIIDLYPEIFSTLLPPSCRSISQILFWPLKYSRRRHLLKADAIVAVSRDYLNVGSIIPAACSQIPLVPLYWGVDVESIRQVCGSGGAASPSRPRGGIQAVYAGTLGEKYDMETLMRAAAALNTQRPQVKFVIAGDGPRRSQIEACVREDGLSNVTVLGPVAAQTLATLYRECDIGLCLYSSGSTVVMPIKAYDYFAAGLPIVSSIKGELQEIISREQCGFTYEAGDADSLTKSLIRLADDVELRSAMASNAYRIGSVFDKRVQYDRIVKLVEHLTSRPRADYRGSAPSMAKA